MIQFNLLPDVKIAYIRAQRSKRIVVAVSVLVIVTMLVITGLLAGNVYVLQKNHIANVTADIESSTQEIQAIDQIDRVLTVQNQLNTISGLHEEKPVASRLFSYISVVTPLEIEITELEIDFDESLLVITGETDTLEDVNIFTDTLKFTEYEVVVDNEESDDADSSDDIELPRAFNGVELNDFSRTTAGTNFVIRISYKPEIFSSESDIRLIIEDTITTRSEQESPDVLFIAPTEEEE